MGVIMDLVTNRVYEFLAKEGEDVLRKALYESLPHDTAIHAPHLDAFSDNPQRTAETLTFLMTKMCSLCEEHIMWKLLTIYRKLPRLTYLTVTRLFETAPESPGVFDAVFLDTIVFGTNVIVASAKQEVLIHSNSRYAFEPTHEELRDATRLMAFALSYRYQLFYLNTMMRRYVSPGLSLGPAVDVYNQRIEMKRPSIKLKDDYFSKETIVRPAFLRDGTLDSRSLHYTSAQGGGFTLVLKNFIPVPFDAAIDKEYYSFLDAQEFTAKTNLSFSDFWMIWTGLNKLLMHSLALMWTQSMVATSGTESLRAALERSDDYTETGLGCGVESSIVKGCQEVAERDYGSRAPSLEMCAAFVEFATCNVVSELDFVEQPFLFYKASSDRLFWDYMRHGGFLKAVARKLRVNDGDKFEEYVKNKISRDVNNVTYMQHDIEIKRADGSVAWQIDVGFVCDDVLILLEAKNWIKPISYHQAKGAEVSDRVGRVERVLNKQDSNLRLHKDAIWRKWPTDEFAGAICIVCTAEVEFICSFESTWWLDSGRIPRICLPNELVSFLNEGGVSALKNHSNFVLRKRD